MALRTDYKDDLLDTSVNTQRKYRMVTNDDGTVSLDDETVYTQNGDTFGAAEVNTINEAVNMVNESLTVDTTNLSDDYSLNGLLQMLAEKYFPSAFKFANTNAEDWSCESCSVSTDGETFTITPASALIGNGGKWTATYSQQIVVRRGECLYFNSSDTDLYHNGNIQFSTDNSTWNGIKVFTNGTGENGSVALTAGTYYVRIDGWSNHNPTPAIFSQLEIK